jgi:hypothetical protein
MGTPTPRVQQVRRSWPRCWRPDGPGCCSVRLQPGMGLVGHNVLHDRSAFVDDPARPRLLYRARFLDRVAVTRTV